MGKRLEQTPNSQIRSALRKIFLWSRERASILKRDKYTCTVCGSKQSRAKGKECRVEVHHVDGIVWQRMYEAVRNDLLNQEMVTLCVSCHREGGE